MPPFHYAAMTLSSLSPPAAFAIFAFIAAGHADSAFHFITVSSLLMPLGIISPLIPLSPLLLSLILLSHWLHWHIIFITPRLRCRFHRQLLPLLLFFDYADCHFHCRHTHYCFRHWYWCRCHFHYILPHLLPLRFSVTRPPLFIIFSFMMYYWLPYWHCCCAAALIDYLHYWYWPFSSDADISLTASHSLFSYFFRHYDITRLYFIEYLHIAIVFQLHTATHANAISYEAQSGCIARFHFSHSRHW